MQLGQLVDIIRKYGFGEGLKVTKQMYGRGSEAPAAEL